MTPLWISLRLPLPLAGCPALPATLLRLTPRLTLLEPHTLALDLTGSQRLFGGPRALWRHTLRACPAGTRAGMAPGAWGAALLAQAAQGPRRVLRLASMRRLLDRLPCTILALAPAVRTQLDDWGCGSLGSLRRLPRAGLAQRGLGPLLEQLDRAYNPAGPAAVWLSPTLAFHASREPAFHGSSLSAIETALLPLLSDLHHCLQAHQAAVDQIDLTLHHDPARTTGPDTRLTLALSRPLWEIDACLYLCRLRIQAISLPGPVCRVTLSCAHLLPRQPLAASLLPDPRLDRQHEDRLLDTLKARLGAACLSYPGLQDWPLPEQAESWFDQPARHTRSEPPLRRSAPDSRPFWLLPSPIRLETIRHGPAWHDRPLSLISGPERIEGGWWRAGSVRRGYFIAQDARAVRYWIYQDLKSGSWFLHGLFA